MPPTASSTSFHRNVYGRRLQDYAQQHPGRSERDQQRNAYVEIYAHFNLAIDLDPATIKVHA